MTTFVVQTSQNLQVDYSEVTASLMLRVIDNQVAISLGQHAQPAPKSNPSTAFTAKSSDLWVNGLWFTSLVLSLTTTLIAVLTKQWINEYIVLPSGSPRDRSRIRHFRFIGLEQWHVPLIISLLPVLMHVSLGVFLAGLIIFLCSLNGVMAAALGCLTGVGLFAYLISNTLPLFYANCPYKTPLALYSFIMVSWVRRCVESWRGAASSVIARSLKEMERTAVWRKSQELDALLVSWLHNTSSNTSVQSIAVQSLAGLPLQNIPVVTGPDGVTAPASDPAVWRFLDFIKDKDDTRPAVIRAIRAHHRIDQSVDHIDRFQRAALRFGNFFMLTRESNKYRPLYKPPLAIGMVRDNILGNQNEPEAMFDVLFWGKLFEVALQSGPDFLKVAPGEGALSPWDKLLRCAAQNHVCALCNCDGKNSALFSFALGPEKFPLIIHSYNLDENGTSRTLSDALMTNMRPSFMRWLLHTGFPEYVSRLTLNYTQRLPVDILLILALLQTRSIQGTVSLSEPQRASGLFSKVLEIVRNYVLNLGDNSSHRDVDRAAIYALKAVVNSDAFGTSTVMTLTDEATIVECLFRGLNRRYEFSGHDDQNPAWLNVHLFKKIWRVATGALESGAVYDPWGVVAHIFAYVSCFASHAGVQETVYAYLVERDWLRELGSKLTRLAKSTTPESHRLPKFWCSYIFVAQTYMDGLSAHTTSEVLKAARTYIEEPDHLSTLSKILLLGDCKTQDRLWELGATIRSNTWVECAKDLSKLVGSKGGELEYAYVRMLVSVDVHGNKQVHYRLFKELRALVNLLAEDLASDHFVPPNCSRPECAHKVGFCFSASWILVNLSGVGCR